MSCSDTLINTTWPGGPIENFPPMLVGTADVSLPGLRCRQVQDTTDSCLMTTDGLHRALHLLNDAQIGRLVQTIDRLRVLMVLGKSRFCCFEIVGHRFLYLLALIVTIADQ